MKAKNGISLIVLVITIVVIIILAAAVILSLGNNNPINNSRVAAVSQTRDNLQSAVSLYLSTKFAKYTGEYDAAQVLFARPTTGSAYDATSNTLPGMTADDVILGDQLASTGYYAVNVAAAKKNLEIDLSQESGTWYVSPSTGKAMVKYTSIPSYLKDGDGVLSSVADFVTE